MKDAKRVARLRQAYERCQSVGLTEAHGSRKVREAIALLRGVLEGTASADRIPDLRSLLDGILVDA